VQGPSRASTGQLLGQPEGFLPGGFRQHLAESSQLRVKALDTSEEGIHDFEGRNLPPLKALP
jgi:hypothetical protein